MGPTVMMSGGWLSTWMTPRQIYRWRGSNKQVDWLQARWGGCYLVRTYSLASSSTLPLAAGDIRDSE